MTRKPRFCGAKPSIRMAIAERDTKSAEAASLALNDYLVEFALKIIRM